MRWRRLIEPRFLTRPNATFPLWMIFPVIFAALYATHLTLLRLPYYWDEAGYYIPAAWDFFRTGSLIPFSTLSNAHPPLPSVYLAAWWKVLVFAPWVTRTAMCAVAATALTAVWRLAMVATGRPSVALSTVLLTGLYPVFFAQSSLAHADLFAAAGTLWALAFWLEGRRWLAAVCFSLAALSKETAIVTPLALAVWELIRIATAGRGTGRHSASRVTALFLPVVPLAAWYLCYWRRTGFVFGNPQYLRYNATETLTPLRILLALLHRTMHVTLHMNLFVPVLAALGCLLLPPLRESEVGAGETGHLSPLRARIPGGQQAVFFAVIGANVVFFSVLGGALLTRYLLPLYPLILLLCVHTFRRRLRLWPALAALSAAAFVLGLFVNPPYRFAPEDNLEYATVIRLQQAAVQEIETEMPGAKVLTAWPASDELSKPELGYVTKPIPVVTIDNFSAREIAKAAGGPRDYSAALVFSTKYDPPHLWLGLRRWNEKFDTRYFDFHRDLPPGTIARVLGGQVVWQDERKGQWAAVLRFSGGSGPREASVSAERWQNTTLSGCCGLLESPDQLCDAVAFAVENRLQRRKCAAKLTRMERRAQRMSFLVAQVIRRIGLVDQQTPGSQRAGEGREQFAQQTPAHDNQVETLVSGGPCQGFPCRFATNRKSNTRFGCALFRDGKTFIGNIGQCDVPAARCQPQRVTAGAAGKIQSAPRAKALADFDQERIGFSRLRFAGKKFGVPAITIVGRFHSHLIDVTLVGY